jgi:hypothetical protein
VGVSWAWCLRIDYRTPWYPEIGWSQWGKPWCWASRNFYFGPQHDIFPGDHWSMPSRAVLRDYRKYVKEMDLWRMTNRISN